MNSSPWRAWLPLISALVYGVSPLDLIPDVLPLLGLADDAVVIVAMVLLALFQLRRNRKMRAAPIPQLPPRR
ncbi:MAG: DUF1232 domain-containing protein [Chthonomonas sp.]|nr:DUF1232 domain-containing protein [Chthonomonas sp.]